MHTTQLAVSLRQAKGKGAARKIRQRAQVPGIIYGKGFDPIMIETDPKLVEQAISGPSKMNTLIELEVPGKGKILTLLKEYQAHVISREFLHLDFLKVDLTKKIEVDIPVHIVGKAEGVKEGGILDVVRRELRVACLPTSIPDFLEADVSGLKIGQSLHVHDLKLPEGVSLIADIDFTIAAVVSPEEETATPVTAEEPKEPEVLTAKKPKEGEEAAKTEKAEKKK